MMFRKWKKRMLLLLVGMLLLSSALAEVDDGIKQLQMKLYNMGFMENKPDGVFGTETEAGLRALQVVWRTAVLVPAAAAMGVSMLTSIARINSKAISFFMGTSSCLFCFLTVIISKILPVNKVILSSLF